MMKAFLKGAGLWAIGLMPFGTRAYSFLTREIFGTQAGHIRKLHRIWPGCVETFCQVLDGSLEGKRIWVQECGCTPFLACVNFLTCGNGGILVNSCISGNRILERHVTESVNMALDLAPSLHRITPVPEKRIRRLDAMRWRKDLAELLEETRTELYEGVEPTAIPIPDGAADLLYSGGALEHYPVETFHGWVKEARRILTPGGLLSPILDHRDHLHHFDKKLPFLYHYRMPGWLYRLTHPHRLLFHNRLTPRDVISLLSAEGFAFVDVHRRSMPDLRVFTESEPMEGEWGLPHKHLARQFSGISERDLRTAAAHYLFTKIEPN